MRIVTGDVIARQLVVTSQTIRGRYRNLILGHECSVGPLPEHKSQSGPRSATQTSCPTALPPGRRCPGPCGCPGSQTRRRRASAVPPRAAVGRADRRGTASPAAGAAAPLASPSALLTAALISHSFILIDSTPSSTLPPPSSWLVTNPNLNYHTSE